MLGGLLVGIEIPADLGRTQGHQINLLFDGDFFRPSICRSTLLPPKHLLGSKPGSICRFPPIGLRPRPYQIFTHAVEALVQSCKILDPVRKEVDVGVSKSGQAPDGAILGQQARSDLPGAVLVLVAFI